MHFDIQTTGIRLLLFLVQNAPGHQQNQPSLLTRHKHQKQVTFTQSQRRTSLHHESKTLSSSRIKNTTTPAVQFTHTKRKSTPEFPQISNCNHILYQVNKQVATHKLMPGLV